MNRRQFLKGLFATGALVALNPEVAIEQFITETEKLSDDEFVDYIRWSMNLWVSNPAKLAYITNIGED